MPTVLTKYVRSRGFRHSETESCKFVWCCSELFKGKGVWLDRMSDTARRSQWMCQIGSLGLPLSARSWQYSHPVQRMKRSGIKWRNDGFESLSCLRAKIHWPTPQGSDIGNTSTV